MTTLYHVIRGEWDGRELRPLSHRMSWDEAEQYIAANWPDCDAYEYYYGGEASAIHCVETLDEARDFADEYIDGDYQIVAIDADGLSVRPGREYPHPTILDQVDASRIEVVA